MFKFLAALVFVSITQVQIIEGDIDQVERVCRTNSEYKGNRTIRACAMPSKNKCLIIWPKHENRRSELMLHELGHCFGIEYRVRKFH